MTAPAPPPVDPELAEAEQRIRAISTFMWPDDHEDTIALRAVLDEYDRRGEVMTSSASALADVLESAAVVPNAELSRLRRIETAARRYVHADESDPDLQDYYADLAAALAAEVEKP